MPAEYAAWLKLHLTECGAITHFYDYPFPRDTFLVATRPFVLDNECGVDARHILVPGDVSWSIGGGMGHNSVHLADGSMRGLMAPVYTDEIFHGLPGYDEGMEAARQASAQFQAQRYTSRRPYSDLTRYHGAALEMERVERVAPPSGASVSVVNGGVRLIPSSMPLDMTPDEALALAENLRAAAFGASR